MISFTQMYYKTLDYIVKRKSSSATQEEVTPPPRKSVYDSILSNQFQTYFQTVVKLLIWEQPYLSAIAFVTLNIFYWLIVSWNRRFFSIVAIFWIFSFLHRTWVKYCWPPLEVPVLEEGTSKSCTTDPPHGLCIPHVYDFLRKLTILFKDVIKLRKENRGLFCSLMCGFFSFLAFIGKIFPGVLIVYGLVLFMTLGPGIFLHLIPETIFDQFAVFFNEMDSPVSPTTASDRDSDLEEFVPELSPETLRQLSLKDDVQEASLGENMEPGSLPEFGEDSYVNESDDFSLYQGLGSFPSVEEENESDLDEDNSDSAIAAPSVPEKDEMRFDPTHFKDSSGSEGDSFTEGLTFGKKTTGSPSKAKVEDTVKTTDTRSLSLSDEDDLTDFEILEESDIPT